MIDVYAWEPELVATWARRAEYRFIHDKFGLGTPRALLELPKFSTWKRAVFDAARKLALSEMDTKRLETLFMNLGEQRCRRPDSHFDGQKDWLRNAETEYDRRSFAAILGQENPRKHPGVITSEKLGDSDPRWTREMGFTPKRTPSEIAGVLKGMLLSAKELHFVDPHFRPQKRHGEVLAACLQVLVDNRSAPQVCVYCLPKEFEAKATFEEAARKMAQHLPPGIQVRFVRLRGGTERFHNRYVLSDLGGAMLGGGLDRGRDDAPEETDDVSLLSRGQYVLRWEQVVKGLHGAFVEVDRPCPITGRLGRGAKG